MVFMIFTTAKSALEILGNSSPTAPTDYSKTPPPPPPPGEAPPSLKVILISFLWIDLT